MTMHRTWILALLCLIVRAPVLAQQPIKVEDLTEETARELTDRSVIIVDGEQATLGELKRQFRERKLEYARSLERATRAWTARSAAYRRLQFRHRRATEEQLSGADKIPAEKARLRLRARAAAHPEIAAIRKEAEELRQRMRTASPDERAAIRRRAAELVREIDPR